MKVSKVVERLLGRQAGLPDASSQRTGHVNSLAGQRVSPDAQSQVEVDATLADDTSKRIYEIIREIGYIE